MLAARRVLSGSLPPVPKQYSGLNGWWDASQITGQIDNTRLATWKDVSGSGNDMAGISSGLGGTYYSSTAGKTVNGHPAVWFAPNQAFNNFNLKTMPAVWTVLAVLIDNAHNQNNTVFGTNTTFESDFLYTSDFSGTAASFEVNAAQSGNVVATAGQNTNGVPYLHSAVMTGAGGTLTSRFNRVAGTPQAVASCITASGTAMYLGGDGAGRWWSGAICELIYYAAARNSTEIAALETYLKTKWGTP